MKNILAAAALTVSSIAHAQMVLQATDARLQPQIGRDQAGFNSCGVRALVLVQRVNVVDTYDFSLVVRTGMSAGTLKAGKYQTTMKQFLQGKIDGPAYTPAPRIFWIAKENEGAAIMPMKVFPSESKGFILAIADIVKTFDVMMAMAQGERMQFAIRYEKEPYDIVVSFNHELAEQEMRPLLACTTALIERMRREAEGEQ